MMQGLLRNAKEQCFKYIEGMAFVPAALLAVVVLVAIIHRSLVAQLNAPPGLLLLITTILALLVLFSTGHFIYTFTRDMEPRRSDNDRASTAPQLRAVFIYGYIFMFTALGVCAAPFFVSVNNSSETSFPAGIVVGCRSNDCATDQEQETHWFLHIGSSISIPRAVEPNAPTNGNSEDADGIASLVVIEGGLAVPLYIVLLALMGGAVSMIRRVPEYQKQAAAQVNGNDTDKAPPINAIRARELVVFQIMQMFTAPLIAVTAFAVFKPDTIAAGTLFGFLSGFSSETILLRLRKAADAMSGRTQNDTPTDAGGRAETIQGQPPEPQGDRDGQTNDGSH